MASVPLNPFRDAKPWGTVRVGGFQLPGVVVSINGAEKPEQWSVQKGTAANNATTVWKGTQIAEAIEIVLAAYDETTFDGLYDLASTLRPKIGNKPPSLVLESAVCNFGGVTRVALKSIGQPTWVAGGNYWTVKVTLIEYNPSKPAKAGPAGSANASAPAKPPTANDVLAAQLEDAMKVAVTA